MAATGLVSAVAWLRSGVAKSAHENPKAEHLARDDMEESSEADLGGNGHDDMEIPTDGPDALRKVLDEDDMEDLAIRETDHVFIAAVSEDDELSHLDMYVYDPLNMNLFVHHDVLLPAFPLSLAWLDFPVGSPDPLNSTCENLVAVSTFEPYIEIWELDKVDEGAPLVLLGGPEDPDMLTEQLRPEHLIPGSHTDAVLGLSWNRLQRNLLASCSADKLVKIWDLCTGDCLLNLTSHSDKVQCLQWNPGEAGVLASGGFDHNLVVVNLSTGVPEIISTTLESDIEALTWLSPPHHNMLLVSTESGLLYLFDVTKRLTAPEWRLEAHRKATQVIAVSPCIPGLIATGSTDKTSPLKIWDISSGQPKLIFSETRKFGPIFGLNFSMNDPMLLVVGVQGVRPVVVDLRAFQSVVAHFDNHPRTDPASFPSQSNADLYSNLRRNFELSGQSSSKSARKK